MSETRYAVQSVHLDPGSFEISYYDRQAKLEHRVHGFTSLLPREIWKSLDWDTLIDDIHKSHGPMGIQAIGEPYPEAVSNVSSHNET